RVGATSEGAARVRGADVGIVAVGWLAGHALSRLAGRESRTEVDRSAGFTVRHRGEAAPRCGIAVVARTRVAVVAGQGIARARLVPAALVDRASAVVRTIRVRGAAAGNLLMGAARQGVAGVVRADVLVVAVRRRPRGAAAVLAGLDAVADIAVP